MKKANLGDVYAFPTERGYRIMQWAFSVERMGKYLKVFPGFYKERPQNLKKIIQGDCTYIINFNAPKLYRVGVFELWDNFPVNEPFPEYELEFDELGNGTYAFEISDFNGMKDSIEFEGKIIPWRYRKIRLLNLIPHPCYFLHMLISDFDLKHLNLLWPTDEEESEIDKKYGQLIFGEDRKKRF